MQVRCKKNTVKILFTIKNLPLTVDKIYDVFMKSNDYGISLVVFDDSKKWNLYDIELFVPLWEGK